MMRSKIADAESAKMNVKNGFLRSKWRKAKAQIANSLVAQYRRCCMSVKKYLRSDSEVDTRRRKSQAKLHPLPDRPLRRVASKLNRKPTNELERLRKKGDDWNANDLFKFQYSDPEEGTPEARKQLCYDWLDRLHGITKKYCYLAWYEAAIYACYYRLAPIVQDQEKLKLWQDVKREYAEIFMMGRRIWRRAIHPSRLRVFYDLATLCIRFGSVEKDNTTSLFQDMLSDANNFDFKVLNEVEFVKSIDKVIHLENHIIDQFYVRRRSSGSIRSSFRSRRNTDRSPSRRSDAEDLPTASEREDDRSSVGSVADSLNQISLCEKAPSRKTSLAPESRKASLAPESRKASLIDTERRTLLIPTITLQGPDSRSRPSSPRLVRFEEDDEDEETSVPE